MPLKTKVLALVLAAAASAAAQRAGAESFHGDYTVSFLGLSIARSSFDSSYKGGVYTIRGSVSSAGLATLFDDTTTKAEVYAEAGIADYWVLDLNGRRLLVFRDPAPLPAGLGATAYRTHLTFGPTDRVSPLAAPASPVAVGELLP